MPLINRATSLRIRRLFRRRKRQVEGIGSVADEHLDKHLFRRLLRLVHVRRFVIGWICLVALLLLVVVLQTKDMNTHYKKPTPVAGGSFTEGIIGSFTTANPIYATNSVDTSASRLIFAGLLKYDGKSNLVPDLAEKMTIDDNKEVYTLTLRPNLKWHDGKPLTAKDVAFTYKLIQNPEARSYLQSSWRGIDVNAVDDRTVTFKLPSKLSAFPHSLVTGILPEHILGKTQADQLRSNSFNTVRPIGAGPFKFDRVQVTGDGNAREESLGLVAFDDYHSGRPKLNRFVIKTFKDEDKLVDSYKQKQIDAMASLSTLSDEFSDDITTQELSPKTLGETMVFFKTTQPPLNDVIVRNALALGANRQQILEALPYPLAIAEEPLLKSHVGYNKAYAQATGNQAQANALLDSAGWVKDPTSGLRSKGGAPLKLRLISQANSEYASVTQSLQKQWRDIGVDAQVSLQSEQELQSSVSQHSYDALLYAISLGPDPDVFAYWHGSQADVRSETRLNFSEYQSSVANEALEGGRTRADDAVRATKYRAFLEAWQKDAPGLVLYQPRYLYVVRSPFYGFDVGTVVSAADRYSHVESWMVKEENRY